MYPVYQTRRKLYADVTALSKPYCTLNLENG